MVNACQSYGLAVLACGENDLVNEDGRERDEKLPRDSFRLRTGRGVVDK
jgi:hypothetical protein